MEEAVAMNPKAPRELKEKAKLNVVDKESQEHTMSDNGFANDVQNVDDTIISSEQPENNRPTYHNCNTYFIFESQ